MRRQSKGGPIGLDLTGDLAQIFMMWWERKYLEKLEQLDIRVPLYTRYVDDIIMMAFTVNIMKRITLNEDETPDNQSMEFLKTTGNKIHKSIELEHESRSMHEDNKIPVLDIKLWLERQTDGSARLTHEFYQKAVSSKSLIQARSSLPWSTKRTVLTQDLLRILLRCSPELPWHVTKTHVETYVGRLQFSGYSRKFRGEIVQSALNAYQIIREKEEQGVQPMYRTKMWNRVERQKERRKKKNDWFKKGGYMSVMFVPATPKSELKRQYERVIKECKVGIKVVECAGRSIKSIVQKTDPFKRECCDDKEVCMVCKKEGSKGQCRRTNVVYKIECDLCDNVYYGETSRNGYIRGTEHTRAHGRNDRDSVLLRHFTQKHINDTQTPTFHMTIVSTHKTALDRQVTEAVRIANTPRDKLLNSKQEFGHNRFWQLRMTSD